MRPRRVCPKKEALQFIASGEDKGSFQKKFINQEKGYGVIATKNIEQGEFLLEYVGRHITGSEGEALFKEYSADDAAFLYFYSFQGQSFCTDGSKDTARLGRFINDDHIKPNSKIKIVLDEQKRPHLCAFATSNISAGEEIVYDYGDPNCPWRQKTAASSCRDLQEKESRWKGSFENLASNPGVMKIGELVFDTAKKIADGSNAAEFFPGFFQGNKVAVKRIAKHISQNEMKIANLLCSETFKAEHLLQPIAVFEDSYFAYFVSPLCEYSLAELIEDKKFPDRESLTEARRLEICQELLQGLQELHSLGMKLKGDLKPENILFDINNKLFIAVFGTSRKLDVAQSALLSQMAGSLSWSSYEDVGGRKELDIQVAGCLVHYILTDGLHPYQSPTPYSNNPLGLSQNVSTGTFTLQCEERHQGIIGRMLCKSTGARPTIEECLQAITSFTHQADHKEATNCSNNNGNKDQTHIANCSPQTSKETDIQYSAISDQPGSVCDVVMDSSSPTEDAISVIEMEIEPQLSLSLSMSEEEDDDGESTEADEEVTKTNTNALECSLNGVQVKMSSNTAHKRVYDKKNYCFYCEKPFSKITRHLMRKHQDEVDVAKALAHKQGSTMRSLLLTKIRNKGNYQHNCSVISARQGEIVPKRQTTHRSSATDFLPCQFCLAMYIKTDLWRHQSRCKLRPDGPVKRMAQASSSFLLPMDHPISDGLKKVVGDMTYDAVTQLVKSDQLILSLGERMFLKNGEVTRHRADIRNKMRELARLVLVARDLDKDIVSLKDLIDPAKFKTVLGSVKKMTGFDHLTNRFAAPSTALKLRHSLVKVSYILQGEALQQGDDDLRAQAERFSKLIELDWTTHVSSNALKTLYQRKWNSPQVLPLAEDIKKLQDHLKTTVEVSRKSLLERPSSNAWSNLSQATLTQLILFNRRREGEVSRMEVMTYQHRKKNVMHDEILQSLSDFEKKLCQNLTRIEVRGKRGRKVPVLLSADAKESIDLLINTRDIVGVSPSNPYIFARPGKESVENIRGCDTLKRYAESCGAKHPENITSTKLRKHVATVSQLLNLQANELDQLATFMGHDINVHRTFYRLPEETLQMAKVSRILFAMQNGMDKFKGKSLEDITPSIDFEDGSSDSETEEVPDGSSDSETEEVHSKEQPAPTDEDGNLDMDDLEERATLSRTGLSDKPVGDTKELSFVPKRKPKRPWSQREREIIEQHFKGFLKEMKIPGKLDCEKCLHEHNILKVNDRDWKAVKYFVHNRITSMKKKHLSQGY